MPEQKTISAIKPTLRDPTRWSIKVGRKFVGALPQAQVEALGLKVGMSWTLELEGMIDRAALADKVYRSATFRLSRRMYSTADLAKKLKMSKYRPTQEVVDQVIEKCAKIGLLDDEAYGRALIRDIQLRKAAGPRLFQTKLFQKGIDRQLIAKLIAETEDDRDDFETALVFAKKKFKTFKRIDKQKARQRLYGQLVRRGFEANTISSVMEKLDWNSLDQEQEDEWLD